MIKLIYLKKLMLVKSKGYVGVLFATIITFLK